MPVSLGWVAEEERRKEVNGLRSQLVVSVQEAQLRSAGGAEGRYGMNPLPGG